MLLMLETSSDSARGLLKREDDSELFKPGSAGLGISGSSMDGIGVSIETGLSIGLSGVLRLALCARDAGVAEVTLSLEPGADRNGLSIDDLSTGILVARCGWESL